MIRFMLFDQTPKVKLARLGALCCITFFLGWIIVSLVRAAEPDPRLAQIQQQRQMLMLQQQNAQLSFENAQLRLKELDAMEEKVKAETKGKVKDAK